MLFEIKQTMSIYQQWGTLILTNANTQCGVLSVDHQTCMVYSELCVSRGSHCICHMKSLRHVACKDTDRWLDRTGSPEIPIRCTGTLRRQREKNNKHPAGTFSVSSLFEYFVPLLWIIPCIVRSPRRNASNLCRISFCRAQKSPNEMSWQKKSELPGDCGNDLEWLVLYWNLIHWHCHYSVAHVPHFSN